MNENVCSIRFYGNLKDLIIPSKRIRYDVHFKVSPGIKDVIESEGVPHTEVGLIIVNGLSAGWKYRLQNNDQIAVYPFFKNIEINNLSKVLEKGYPAGRFILDVHLGRLVKHLRILGFDASYNPEWDDNTIIELSNREKRIILTRDRGILKNGLVRFGYLVRSIYPQEQLRQVLDRFDLWDSLYPLIRCLECNGEIVSVPAETVKEVLEENTKKYFNDFYQCSSCGKVYWKGTHYERMKKDIGRLFANRK